MSKIRIQIPVTFVNGVYVLNGVVYYEQSLLLLSHTTSHTPWIPTFLLH